MKKWGLLITLYYLLVVLVLLMPMFVLLFDASSRTVKGYFDLLFDYYTNWFSVIPVFVVVGGQILLLVLSVDTSFRRNKPRAHILVSISLVGFFLMILGFATISSLLIGILGDKFGDYFDAPHTQLYSYLALWPALWLLWGIVFYFQTRTMGNPLSRAVSWLLKGSVLELLVAVSCHVISRRRDDCTAPFVTSFGICSGIAIMLLAFGPSVLFLYKKRMASYAPRN